MANLDAEGMKTEDDFTRYKEATEKRIQEAKNKNHMTPEAVQKAVNDGIAAAMQKTPLKQEGGSQELADLQRKLAGVEEEQKKVSSERDVATGELSSRIISSELLAAAVSSGVRPQSASVLVAAVMPHVELDAKRQVRSKLESSYGPDLDAAGLIKKLKADPSFSPLWPESKGGGAVGGNNDKPPAGNPWNLKQWDALAQHKLIAENREKAEALAKEAGLSSVIVSRQTAEAIARNSSA